MKNNPEYITTKRSLLAEIVHMSILFISILVVYLLMANKDILLACFIGASIYLITTWLIPSFINREFNRGVKAFKKRDYKDAAKHFEDSYNFLFKYPWLDKWRYLTLGISSTITLTQITATNALLCYQKLGDKKKIEIFTEKVELIMGNSK